MPRSQYAGLELNSKLTLSKQWGPSPRPYLKKEFCVKVIESPLKVERQENNRYRFWASVKELEGRYLRVVTLEDKITVHNAFLDRSFKP